MKVQEVITRALSGQISWWQAAEIIEILGSEHETVEAAVRGVWL